MKWPRGEQWLYLANIVLSRWVNSGKNITTYYPKNILCVKWDEIGDMAACTHVFTLLKSKFPDAEIDVLTKPYSADLIKNNPAISNIITEEKLWNKKYDLVVEFRGSWKTLFRSLRYYPKVRLDRGLVRYMHKGKQLHETHTNYEIIKPVLGDIKFVPPKLYPLPINEDSVELFLRKNNIQKFVVIHAGARRELRRWRPERFAEIADWLFTQQQLMPVFAGTESEEMQISEITSKMQSPFYLFTKSFGLLDLAALINKSAFFLGNESGPLQIADAMGKKSIGLFGPGVADVFYPQTKGSEVLHHVLDCNPCDQIHCVRPENPCMNLIAVEAVKQSISRVLAE